MPVIVPNPDTIRGPIESEFNGLRNAIEETFVADLKALHEEFHLAIKTNALNKQAALVAAGLNPDGGTPSDYPASVPVVDPPVNTVVPTISGTTTVDEILTADEGTWTGDPTFTYQWVRADSDETNAEDIVGATAVTYTLLEADEGKKVLVVVTGTNSGGNDIGMSVYSAVIAPAV